MSEVTIWGLPKEFLPVVMTPYGPVATNQSKPEAMRRAQQKMTARLKAEGKIKTNSDAVALSSKNSFQLISSNKPNQETNVPATLAKPPKTSATKHIVQKCKTAPRHLLPTFKAFTGPDAATQAYESGLMWQVFEGRAIGRRNLAAEQRLRERGHDLETIFAIATEGSPTSGGYAAPDPLSAAIAEVVIKYGVAEKICGYYPMAAEKLTIPKETSGVELSVRYPGEAGLITTSDLEFGAIGLTAVKRATFSYFSSELKDDALLSYVDLLVSRSGKALASQKDNELVNADGSSAFGGELGLLASLGAGGVVTATGHSTWASLTLADFGACMGKVPGRFATGGESWLCHPSYFAIAMLPAAGGNAQGWTADGRPMYLGRPVNLCTKMPATSAGAQVGCLYGDFEIAVALGDRGVRIAFSEHAQFANDVIAARAVARYDFAPHEMGDGTNAGAVVGLSTAS